MTLHTVIDDNEPTSDVVSVRDTHIGKAVFAMRNYPCGSVIGQITGQVIDDPYYGSAYSFELSETQSLDPDEPFRFLNHSCSANCEFDFLEDSAEVGGTPKLYVIATRNIYAYEQLTIEYNWPATSAIRCECGADNCRGWVVSLAELEFVDDPLAFQAELEEEVATHTGDESLVADIETGGNETNDNETNDNEIAATNLETLVGDIETVVTDIEIAVADIETAIELETDTAIR